MHHLYSSTICTAPSVQHHLYSSICTAAQAQSRKHILDDADDADDADHADHADHADYEAPTGRQELDNTDHTDQDYFRPCLADVDGEVYYSLLYSIVVYCGLL